MALDSNRLLSAMAPRMRAEIIANFDAKWPISALENAGATEEQVAQATEQRQDFADALAAAVSKIVAEEVVIEITTNAEVATALVSAALSVLNVSGVTAGGDVSGPGTGTIDNGNATGTVS